MAALVPTTQTVISGLRTKLNARSDADRAVVRNQAVLARKDDDLDERTRACRLEVLAAAGKDRMHSGYRAAFPKGLTALTSLRGQQQADGTQTLATVLGDSFPDIAERRSAESLRLATEAVTAEKAHKDALLARGNARAESAVDFVRFALLGEFSETVAARMDTGWRCVQRTIDA